MTSKWEQAKKVITSDEVKPWDMLKPSEYASEEKSESRYLICKICDKFNKVVKTCQECGCFMPGKTKLEQAVCPMGKW
jgi:hypothetical protein